MYFDILDVLTLAGLSTAAVVAYLIFVRKPAGSREKYNEPDWNYPLKLLWARYAVRKWKSKLTKSDLCETPLSTSPDGWDSVVVQATAPEGPAVVLGIRKLCGRKPLVEVTVILKLLDGTVYTLPQHPQTAVGAWEDVDDGWSGGGLKIQVLEPERLRIIYNGLLTQRDDQSTQHVTLNFIWAAATSAVRFPEDWSEQLAAAALAQDPWHHGDFTQMLNSIDGRSWLQWGAMQGRVQAFDDDGAVVRSEYLRLRGVRERAWGCAPAAPRRSLSLAASAPDGTAVHLRAVSYNNRFTQCLSGCVRFPDFTIESITATDLQMKDFCETPDEVPSLYTINVSTRTRTVRVVVRAEERCVEVWSGVPRARRALLRPAAADIDGRHGTGLLELGYFAPDDGTAPLARLLPPKRLRWLTVERAGAAGLCVSLAERAAACPQLVGGKGASLALLASVQTEQGYRVPPGFCVTTKAFDKQLEAHPEIMAAILKIEATNEDYEEEHFKRMCTEASELIAATEVIPEVEQSVLRYLEDLQEQAAKEGFGSDVRFAVRSSAVGEDGEALSAAGQNDTVLGCRAGHVLRAVRRCWASAFAFTSASYRRQNGQACLCACGVVVQVLCAARAAGVLLTRAPARPARLLLTASYGLGESVVSGAVEPDTIMVKRDGDELSIASIEVGSKAHSVVAGGEGVGTEPVPREQRVVACLTAAEALRLARAGAAQEELWGAPRDIEWAIVDDEIFLLQARPITSLDRWTEEELLHELDFPIMADDELLSFANVGEVLPKPVSPLSFDVVNGPLAAGVAYVVQGNRDGYDRCIVATHYRLALALYNTTYRRVPKKIDIGIRMLEMSIHGHKVATDDILQTALRRRPSRFYTTAWMTLRMIKELFWTKTYVKRANAIVAAMNAEDVDTTDPLVLLDQLAGLEDDLRQVSVYHALTSTASSFSQFIAMSVLLEGKDDFTTEQCNEIGTLLNSGSVVSAEVPRALAALGRRLARSGRAAEFRAQPPRAALAWLQHNLPEIHRDVCHFLDQHGHRAIMEFDLSTKPWVLVPEELMIVLAQMRLSDDPVEEQPSKSDEEMLNALKSPQKSSTRRVLGWVVGLCRRAVRQRERSKAALVRGVHAARAGARRLAASLARRWLLPHADLVFYFRLHELRRYIRTRDPLLLRKAIQRHQYYSGWAKLKFAELNTGWVEPLQQAELPLAEGGVTLQGTPACGGDVVGRACVIKDLSQIGELQQGDILITYATDIGWSPYFPLLSGIVTELGGLISHGAVIAREYGLPCVVGAARATDLFRTGDTVRLAGAAGRLAALSPPPAPPART